MATKEQLIEALMKADEAGDTEAAQMFADELKSLSAAKPAVKPEPLMNETGQKLLAADTDVASNEARAARRYQEFEDGPTWAKPIVAASDIASGLSDSMTFGFGDKAAASISALMGTKPYDEALAENRGRTQAAADRSGWAGTAANIGGALATGKLATDAGITASKIIPEGTGLMTRLLSAAGIGGLEGAAYGALDASGHDQDVKSGALTGAALGAGVNTASEAAVSAAGKILEKIRGTNKAPSIDDLKSTERTSYKAMEDMGARYTPDHIAKLADDLQASVVDVPGGARPTNHAATLDKLDEIRSMVPRTRTNKVSPKAKPVGMYDLDEVRKSVRRDLADGPDTAFASRIIKGIDDTMADIDPSKVTSLTGTPEEALAALNNARDLHYRASKADELGTAVVKADRRAASNATGDTSGNQMRQNVRAILDNDARSAQFKPEELAALEKVVEGTRTGNWARKLASEANSDTGKYTGIVGGSLLGNMVMPGPMGTVVGGTLGRLGAKVTGDIAEKVSARSTRKGIQNVIDDITRGRPRVPSRSEVPISPEERDLATRLLLLMKLQDDNGAKD